MRLGLKRASILASVACVLAAAVGCAGGGEVRGILLITLDTTRADRLGCYGYADGSTPHLDALAASGAIFREAQSSVPVTLPSHSTMFTGLYPAHHGVRYNGMFRLGEASVTVAELLRDAGWSTAGFPASYPVTKSTGVGQGFETYADMFEEEDLDSLPADAERRANEITDRVLAWFDRRDAARPFFVWAHYFDPHAPYEPPFPYSSTFRGRPYDGEIAFTDAEIGRLLDGLREHGVDRDVVIIVAGDHGEGLFDHGEKMHANLVYQSTLHAPLMIQAPGGPAGMEIEEPVALADVAPTILDYAGVPGPPMDGISLREAVSGREPPIRDIYVESLAGSLLYAWSPLEGVRRGPWKYVRSTDPELFDLAADPGETTNLAGTDPARVADMDAALRAMMEGWAEASDAAETTEVPLDQEELDRLASLGYVGGTIGDDRRGGPNPRDLIHLESAILYAGDLQREGEFAAALRQWDIVLEADPENRHALATAAVAASRSGRHARAESLASRVTELYPDFLPGHITRGENRLAQGDLAGAIPAFEAGLEHKPGESALLYRLAVAHLENGDVDASEAVVRQALESEDEPYFRVILATCLARRGEIGDAETEFERAVRGGYERRDVLENDPLLGALRDLPGFSRILALVPEPPPPPPAPAANEEPGT